jgi:endonuclease V-like protein UPF0215 family
MLTFFGLIVVFFIILYKRSTEIIVVNPLQGRRPEPPAGEDAENEAADPRSVPDFARLLNTIQQASQIPASAKGRVEIVQLVQNNQFIEAMQLYRRLYGVDLQTAKKAVDKIMLEK